jgi:disulfide bond formation protein DsbB
MSNGPRATKSWNTKQFALSGAILGFVVGIGHAYVHAFWSPTLNDSVIEHILWRMALYVVAGAALLAAVSPLRNRLVQRS